MYIYTYTHIHIYVCIIGGVAGRLERARPRAPRGGRTLSILLPTLYVYECMYIYIYIY